jgi:hypothetical protein
MDNNNIVGIQVVPQGTCLTKKCKVCGKTLPISEFIRKGKGYMATCKGCLRKENGTSERFSQFTSRELIDELKYRGYKGTLRREVVEEIKI